MSASSPLRFDDFVVSKPPVGISPISKSARPKFVQRVMLVLAIFAMVGMCGVTSWHNADPHDHDTSPDIHLSQAHGDDKPEQKEQHKQSDAMHVGAHSLLHELAAADTHSVIAAMLPSEAAKLWGRQTSLRSLAPPSILRPPRA